MWVLCLWLVVVNFGLIGFDVVNNLYFVGELVESFYWIIGENLVNNSLLFLEGCLEFYRFLIVIKVDVLSRVCKEF